MRAGRAILIVALLVAGCTAQSKKRGTKERRDVDENPSSVQSSALDKRLCQVAAEGDLDSVRAHLAAGACVNARDEGEATPLHRAVAGGHREVVELLIAHGANVNAVGGMMGGTPLCEAVATDYALVADDLLKTQRPDLGHDDKLYWELREKFTKRLMLDIVQILIEHGADVNAREESGGTVLFFVLGDNTSVEVVKFLLAHGADPSLKDDYGTTVLHEATADGLADLVALFLDSGTDVDLRDADRQTPLHEAVWQDDKEMVELLLARGADITARDKNGDTPLHIAAVNDYGRLFDLLLSRGADPKARNKQRLTPVAYARLAPPQEMIRLTPEGAWPYSVIITRMSGTRRFLQVRRVAFDRIWIPREVDIKRAEAILKSFRDNGEAGRKKEAFGSGRVVIDIGHDNREYAGFMRGSAKFVLCNMNNRGPNARPLENQLSSPGFDEWGVFRLAVIALDTEQVEWIESEYF